MVYDKIFRWENHYGVDFGFMKCVLMVVNVLVMTINSQKNIDS